jgi:hypothetical protein
MGNERIGDERDENESPHADHGSGGSAPPPYTVPEPGIVTTLRDAPRAETPPQTIVFSPRGTDAIKLK